MKEKITPSKLLKEIDVYGKKWGCWLFMVFFSLGGYGMSSVALMLKEQFPEECRMICQGFMLLALFVSLLSWGTYFFCLWRVYRKIKNGEVVLFQGFLESKEYYKRYEYCNFDVGCGEKMMVTVKKTRKREYPLFSQYWILKVPGFGIFPSVYIPYSVNDYTVDV